jgi:hypothetical protein
MKFWNLVLKGARRSKRRTALTIFSVAIAVFLFVSLRAVLDGFNAGAEASSSTRIVTVRSTSLFFSMPTSHADLIKRTPASPISPGQTGLAAPTKIRRTSLRSSPSSPRATSASIRRSS